MKKLLCFSILIFLSSISFYFSLKASESPSSSCYTTPHTPPSDEESVYPPVTLEHYYKPCSPELRQTMIAEMTYEPEVATQYADVYTKECTSQDAACQVWEYFTQSQGWEYGNEDVTSSAPTCWRSHTMYTMTNSKTSRVFNYASESRDTLQMLFCLGKAWLTDATDGTIHTIPFPSHNPVDEETLLEHAAQLSVDFSEYLPEDISLYTPDDEYCQKNPDFFPLIQRKLEQVVENYRSSLIEILTTSINALTIEELRQQMVYYTHILVASSFWKWHVHITQAEKRLTRLANQLQALYRIKRMELDATTPRTSILTDTFVHDTLSSAVQRYYPPSH